MGLDETRIHDGLSEFRSVVRALQDLNFRWFVMIHCNGTYIFGVYTSATPSAYSQSLSRVALASRENKNCASESLHLHIEGNTLRKITFRRLEIGMKHKIL